MQKLQVEKLAQMSDLPRTSISLMMKLLFSEVPCTGTEIQRWILYFCKGSSNVWVLGVLKGR